MGLFAGGTEEPVRKKLPKYREHMNLVQSHEVSIREEERS